MKIATGAKEYKLPDFIIAGAMKAGTTTLHSILNELHSIFMPEREILFFDIDDTQQNFDFFVGVSRRWLLFDYEEHFDEYLDWYSSFFLEAGKNQMIGEDSTTYMASTKAPKRIAKLLPDVKLIFLLRDPISRAYSHYWHLVKTGYAIYNFERTIQYMPGTILQRGFYKKQIQRYKKLFPEKNLKFIIFEDFIHKIQETTDDICTFLGLQSTINTRNIGTHRNPAKVPRCSKFQIMYNHLTRTKRLTSKTFGSHLPISGKKRRNFTFDKFDNIVRRISLERGKKYPPMKEATRDFLQNLFAMENRGLAELIGIDIKEFWPYIKR